MTLGTPRADGTADRGATTDHAGRSPRLPADDRVASPAVPGGPDGTGAAPGRFGVSAPHAEALIDLSAIEDNARRLRELAGPAEVMAVVKADGYGHGMLESARAARAGGATWIGVAALREALALRRGGLPGRLLAWLLTPGDDWDAALAADIDVSAGATWAIEAVSRAARSTGRTARVHLKVDTGLGRGGPGPDGWPALVNVAARAEAAGCIQVVGIWSHLARADEPGHPDCDAQLANFQVSVALARQAGLHPEVLHLANSAATLTLPEAHFDLVRPGLALYGLSPVADRAAPADFGLRPAMTLTAPLASVKRVPADHGVSYGHRYRTPRATTLGLVPLGYADGIPRHASGTGPVLVGGGRHTVAGTVCMDQFVVDLGESTAEPGDEVVLFGPGDRGEPGAEDWARAAGSISHEIVARIGSRVPRRHIGGTADAD
ncbi:alanine racemase [Streptomyces sp. bgisy100]|uniref:alanine racemase n=1 Tax=Streptomyces sp. bgisy100 TaxID=3413783 RepID=UPI003D7193AF